MAEELKPCPFCGGQADVQSERCGWRVVCVEIECSTCGPWPTDCTEAEAIAAWNTRAAIEAHDSAVAAEREALNDAVEFVAVSYRPGKRIVGVVIADNDGPMLTPDEARSALFQKLAAAREPQGDVEALFASATPGPWEAHGCELVGFGTLIATLHWHSGRGAANEADGRFIAAARTGWPADRARIAALEAALQEVLRCFDSTGKHMTPFGGGHPNQADAVAQARAALAPKEADDATD